MRRAMNAAFFSAVLGTALFMEIVLIVNSGVASWKGERIEGDESPLPPAEASELPQQKPPFNLEAVSPEENESVEPSTSNTEAVKCRQRVIVRKRGGAEIYAVPGGKKDPGTAPYFVPHYTFGSYSVEVEAEGFFRVGTSLPDFSIRGWVRAGDVVEWNSSRGILCKKCYTYDKDQFIWATSKDAEDAMLGKQSSKPLAALKVQEDLEYPVLFVFEDIEKDINNQAVVFCRVAAAHKDAGFVMGWVIPNYTANWKLERVLYANKDVFTRLINLCFTIERFMALGLNPQYPAFQPHTEYWERELGGIQYSLALELVLLPKESMLRMDFPDVIYPNGKHMFQAKLRIEMTSRKWISRMIEQDGEPLAPCTYPFAWIPEEMIP